ncbi:response regulator transcription factor [Schlesneria paludicola]|uniref:response regulator transcription factor n=1 Tax=Schlesneria paludicola TaxID=360056 RepID=UPI00029AC726|nr:response regulator transcription factor [Schlesneria paludicola]
MKKLRIVVADDHGVVRDGLTMLINAQQDMEVTGEAANGADAIDLILRLSPDVAIIDISMPILNGIELVSQISAARVEAKLLVLTANEDRNYMQRVLKLGAAGYLLKRSAADELIKAIRTTVTGGRYLDPLVIDDLVGEIQAPRPAVVDESDGNLSEREDEVLRLIAQGYSNKEIAARLGVSIKTIETYKSRSVLKLGLSGRADIVRYAIRKGWLREE